MHLPVDWDAVNMIYYLVISRDATGPVQHSRSIAVCPSLFKSQEQLTQPRHQSDRARSKYIRRRMLHRIRCTTYRTQRTSSLTRNPHAQGKSYSSLNRRACILKSFMPLSLMASFYYYIIDQNSKIHSLEERSPSAFSLLSHPRLQSPPESHTSSSCSRQEKNWWMRICGRLQSLTRLIGCRRGWAWARVRVGIGKMVAEQGPRKRKRRTSRMKMLMIVMEMVEIGKEKSRKRKRNVKHHRKRWKPPKKQN